MEEVLNVLLDRKIVVPIIIIVVATLLYLVLSKLIKRLLCLKLKGVRINVRRQKTLVSLISNILKYFFFFIALMMILEVYGIDTKSLVASVGVISLVMA